MSGTSPSIALSITAVDKTGSTLDQISRDLDARGKKIREGFTSAGIQIREVGGITKSVGDSVAKSMGKLGDTSGVNRLSEGMRALGSRSLDAFRSLDRIAPALGAITGAASLAGMATLVQRWSQMGQQMVNTSQRLGVPTDRLTALQGAARLAGSSAEAVTSGLGSLDEKLRGATFRGDALAIQTFNRLGVAFKNADGSARDAGASFGDVANGIKRLYDSGPTGRGAALRAAQNLGLEDLFPLLLKGRSGIQDLSAEAARLGGVISPEAAKRAEELHSSFAALNIALDGVMNRLGDRFGTAAKPYIDQATQLIAKNKEVANSWIATGTAIGAYGGVLLAAAKWMPGLARLLTGGTALGLTLGLNGDTDPTATPNGFLPGWKPDNGASGIPYGGQTETFGGMVRREWNAYVPTWLGGGRPSGGGDDAQVPVHHPRPAVMGSTAYEVMGQSHDFWRNKGLTEAQTAGVLATEADESSFNPSVWNKDHTSYGLYQMTGDRLRAMQERYHTNEPSAAQQREYAYWELTDGPEHFAGSALRNSRTSQESGRAFTGFERPAGMVQRAQERGDAAPLFENHIASPQSLAAPPGRVDGDVNVHVTIAGAPPGTTVKSTATGQVNATPPKVALPMSGIPGDYHRGF